LNEGELRDQENRPVALLIEDQPDLLRAKQNLFSISGFQPICVRTAAEALREFIATPAVDIIIADINLDVSNADDKSGVDVATTIRDMRRDVPIVAVSGRVDLLTEGECRPFSDTLVKGKSLSINDYFAKVDEWLGEAIAYRERRTECGRRAVAALDADDESHAIDYEVLREFLPGRRLTDDPQTGGGRVTPPDEVLRAAGWWLQLIQAGQTVRTDTAVDTRTQLAVPIWLRKDGADHLAVLHGYSFVSCRAAEPGAAVEQLLRIMAACHENRLQLYDDVNEGERRRLLGHLKAVFG
jgi:CheY-like chemotaxis protein